MENVANGELAQASTVRVSPGNFLRSIIARRAPRPFVFVVALLLVAATRWPLMPSHLYDFDSANFAFAIHDFDPSHHQPQPPGYPYFVAELRAAYAFLNSPEQSFAMLAIFIGSLALASLYLLARRMFGCEAGLVGAALFLVNPIFWYSGLASPVRLHLALVSLVTAYCCWRAISGETRYLYYASIALGLGAGFRPDALVVLLPLWLWSEWRCWQPRIFIRSALLLITANLLWLGTLAAAYGGIQPWYESWLIYLRMESPHSSVLLAGPVYIFRRTLGRVTLWNSLGMLSWLWCVPPTLVRRRSFLHSDPRIGFLVMWFTPPFLFNVFVHTESPGHVLSSVPVICILGGVAITWVAQAAIREKNRQRTSLALCTVAVLINVGLFFWPYSVPQVKVVTRFRGLESVKDALFVGTFETSLARIQYREERTAEAILQIERLEAASDRPVVLIWTNDALPVWRKLSFYFPSTAVYELMEEDVPGSSRPSARLWRGSRMTTSYAGAPVVRLPVPKGARIIWVALPTTAGDLDDVISLHAAFPVYYSDLPADWLGVRWRSFELYPE